VWSIGIEIQRIIKWNLIVKRIVRSRIWKKSIAKWILLKSNQDNLIREQLNKIGIKF
jgi:hypothetical protein